MASWYDGYVYETDFKDDLVDGKQYSWDKNGKLVYEFGYKDGKAHGRHVSWYKNGNIHMEGYYNEGTGKFIARFQSGKISIEAESKNGKKYGKEIWWYENGRKKQEQTYNEEGKNIGKLTHWYEDGKVKYEEEYDQNGQRLYKKDYDQEGNLIFDNDQHVSEIKPNGISDYPPKYDLRYGADCQVTPVRDQFNHGTCWAFGWMGALEHRVLLTDPNPQYSPLHLADKNHGYDADGVGVGSSDKSVMAYLTRGGGPVNETTVPYAASKSEPLNVTRKQISYPPVKWVWKVTLLTFEKTYQEIFFVYNKHRM